MMEQFATDVVFSLRHNIGNIIKWNHIINYFTDTIEIGMFTVLT